MKYQELAETYNELESTSKRLKKTYIISKLLKKTKESDIEKIMLLLQGKVFAAHDIRETGIASKLMVKAIATATGYSTEKIEDQWRKKGDLGLVAEYLVSEKKQNTLFSEELTIKLVFDSLQKLSTMEGLGSVDQKIKLIAKLLSAATPIEAKYVVRAALQDLRVGVAEGTLRDAIAWAYMTGVEPNYDEKTDAINPENREEYSRQIDLIQQALNKSNDFLEAANAAKEGEAYISKMKLQPGKPIKVMLAQKVLSIKEGFETVGTPAALEYKYDGFRMLISKSKENVVVYTRRLEEVTKQFPEVKDFILKNTKCDDCIIDCEAAGYDSKSGNYTPFQSISQRIKRKYDIEKLADELPIELNVFDILYLDGKELLNTPFSERRKLLEKIIVQEPKKIVLSKQILSSDEKEAENFFNESIKKGNEGIMFKNLNGIYKPGSRVGYMIKYKSSMDPLDLVVIGAEWGEGKRSGWFTSFVIACECDGEFLEIGRVGTGLKEKREEGLSFDELTELLKPLIIEQKGREVKVKPKIVLSILFEEIQKSPSYSSGYALRFPRVVLLRDDRSSESASTLEDVEEAYYLQRKK
jgi:DNA ligase-1